MKPPYTIAIIIAFTIISQSIISQISNVEIKALLPYEISESSGLLFFDGQLITHNDSGGANELYVIDTLSWTITRTVTIDNAMNIDWEDLTQDSSHIYIADIGNNNGTRTDLRVYKILKTDFLNNNNVTAEIIDFYYSDQTDFSSNPNYTEWDAEALICIDTNLLLFNKNWVTQATKAYVIPKYSGSHSCSPMPTELLNAGLITGATYNEFIDELVLVGYNSILQPFVWFITNFSADDIFSGTNSLTTFTSLGAEQLESVAATSPNKYLMTSESFNFGTISEHAKVISFSKDTSFLLTNTLNQLVFKLTPNPVSDFLHISGGAFKEIQICNLQGEILLKSNHSPLNISQLTTGTYLLTLYTTRTKHETFRILKQ